MKTSQLNQKNKKSTFQAGKLAELVAGKLQADPDLKITGFGGVGSAGPTEMTYAESDEFLEIALNREVGLILLTEELYQKEISAIIVANPKLAYARLASYFVDDRFYKPGIAGSAVIGNNFNSGKEASIHEQVIIGDDVRIGDRVRIAPGVIIGDNCQLGDDVLLHPGVILMADTSIGNRVEIQAGAVIGADGFGYVSDGEKHFKIPQLGRVKIEDDVEIGALTAVDRAANQETVVGQGTKIDNLVQIGHNVKIGKNSLIVGQAGVGGSAELGEHVILAGQAGIEDHIQISDRVTITAKAKVSKDLKKPGFYSGIPAQEHRQYLKEAANIRRIDKLKKEITDLKGELEEIQNYLKEED
ncbi:MAG: UDP-3-O-(3-hydroxymyristoyl)glucosamine N-acyltransferase [Bacillota bacterium]